MSHFSLDEIREAVRARLADATSTRLLQQETGVSKSSLQRFADGSDLRGANKARLQKWAAHRLSGTERDEGGAPLAGGGPLVEYYRGVFDVAERANAAANRMQAEIQLIFRDARLGVERGTTLPPVTPPDEAERLARAQAALDVHQQKAAAKKAAQKAPARKRHTAG